MRSLNSKFIDDLKQGVLSPLLDAVKSDKSLCLELRGDSVNVYYRGGSLMKITQYAQSYTASFDENYFRSGKQAHLRSLEIRRQEDVEKWLELSPQFKHAMDCYFGRHQWNEREFQQLIVRDNNFGASARSTDYYICDIEYASMGMRFDMIAVHWPSTSAQRKKQYDRRLVLVEMKHGDNALKGNAGLHKHIIDVNDYLSDSGDLQKLKEDMREVFNQKCDLGLIKCQRNLISFSDEKPLLLLAFANHDPEKSALDQLLEKLPSNPHIDMRIATASFLGYALYDQGICTIEEVTSANRLED